jgi:hypothetical protein
MAMHERNTIMTYTHIRTTFSHCLSALALVVGMFATSLANAAVLKADFNNDGYEDLVVGSQVEDVGSIQNAGAISVFYGTASGLPRSPSRQWYQDSPGIAGVAEAHDNFGNAVAVGDFNRDGYDDVAISVPAEDIAGVGSDSRGRNAGVVNVIYGSAGGLHAQGNQMLSLATLHPSLAQAEAFFGNSLAAADFNGDGYEDLAVGVPAWNHGAIEAAGAVAVFFGGSSGFADGRGTFLYQGQSHLPITSKSMDFFGESLTAADFDRDGYADLAIGIPYKDFNLFLGIRDAGAVAVVYGTANSDGFRPSGSHILLDQCSGAAVEPGDIFGSALTAGDFNGDGYADLAVGAPGEDDGAEEAGAVTLIFGSRSGVSGSVCDYWPANRSGLPDKAEKDDFFGSSLAAADFNGDGFADLAIGVPYEKQERTLRFDHDATGQVTVLYGSRNGMIVNTRSYWHQDQPNVESARGEFDRFGQALSVGDFNDDNLADLVVGVPGEGADDEGSVHIFYGTSAGLSADPALGRQLISEIGVSQEEGDLFGDALP